MKPVFSYTVTCQACGWTAPGGRLVMNRAAMDEAVRYHRSTCPGRPS